MVSEVFRSFLKELSPRPGSGRTCKRRRSRHCRPPWKLTAVRPAKVKGYAFCWPRRCLNSRRESLLWAVLAKRPGQPTRAGGFSGTIFQPGAGTLHPRPWCGRTFHCAGRWLRFYGRNLNGLSPGHGLAALLSSRPDLLNAERNLERHGKILTALQEACVRLGLGRDLEG